MLRPDWIDHPELIPDPMGRGQLAVKWLRMLMHPKSNLAGKQFQLDPWQEAIIRAIYGPRDEFGNRIIRRVVIVVPRGGRKTSLSAALTLLHLVGPESQMGQLIVGAASALDQSKELFEEVAGIINIDRRFQGRVVVRDYVNRIAHKKSGSRYVAVAADGDALHGKTPNVVIKDELHAWSGNKGQKQYDALDSALVKVPNTLDITITTSGRGQENLAWRVVEYAMRVQKGQIVDPATLPVLFMAEPEDDWKDPALWAAVNPGMAHGYPDLKAFQDKAAKAENSPSERDSFLQYNLNRWLDASTSPFVEMHIYDRGAFDVDLDDLEMEQAPCYIGVDLSKNEDLTAVVCAWRTEGGGYAVKPYFFCPEENLRGRGERHGVDYIGWAEDGFITPTSGNVVDLRAVEAHIRELCARFNVKEIAFDPTFGRSMMADLVADGLPAVEFRQGWVSMGPAVKELERAILAGQLTHGGNPVLRWNFENIQVETDKAGVRMFHKAKSGNKIDGAVACAMAVARAAAGAEKFVTSADWFTDDMWVA